MLAMKEHRPLAGADGLTLLAWEESGGIGNDELRKRERPFMGRLTPDTVPQLERASYFGAYKGVTDLLTKYLWPEWALVLTRWAARIGMSPNQVTLAGRIVLRARDLVLLARLVLAGLAAGLVFMVLDTVDGKLARCTITSSRWGEVVRSRHRSRPPAFLVVGLGRGARAPTAGRWRRISSGGRSPSSSAAMSSSG